MMRELWGSFPRLLENNINGLLDTAFPTPAKAFQLYRTCRFEGLWSKDYAEFSTCLEKFYSTPRRFRKKSDLDCAFNAPVHAFVYENFHLNFRTAQIEDKEIRNLASWAHHIIRITKKSVSQVFSLEIIYQTLHSLVHPGPLDKTKDIEFDDFCGAWSKTAFKTFGNQHNQELGAVLKELQSIHRQLKEADQNPQAFVPFATVELNSAEMKWLNSVRTAAKNQQAVPPLPNSGGARTQTILELQRIITLYELSQTNQLKELKKYRERIRATLIERCELLLKKRVS